MRNVTTSFIQSLLLVLGLTGWATFAHADCVFSSTPSPTITAYTVSSDDLALNGASFIQHGNVMAAGKIDNLIFFHADGEIIPQITNIVYARISVVKQMATYTFTSHDQIRVDLHGVTTKPHSQRNVPALYIHGDDQDHFFLICN